MRKFAFVLGLAAAPAWAQAPAILLEACNAMEPASKGLECLRAANGVHAQPARASSMPQAAYAVPATAAPTRSAATSGSSRTVGSQTCYTGPRGGTYTITASGRKNYSGC